MTMFEILFVERHPLRLLDLNTLRFKSFARLWKYHGEAMSAEMPGPTFQLISQCKGIVLDIGPGSGEMLSQFDPQRIIALYGAEPSKDLHPRLVRNAEKRGLGYKFHPLICGGEPASLIPALHNSGVLDVSGRCGSASEAVFDEICCIRVLCGVPHPQQTIEGLYNILKPGGRMVICEHVVNPWRTKGKVTARFMQMAYTLLGWPFFMGGCELTRHTVDFLRNAGEWEKFDLQYYGAGEAIPFAVGELIKKSSMLEKTYAAAAKT